jgi:hypothetical protein
MNKKSLSSKLTGNQPKIKMYISTIRPIVTYAAETWALRKTEYAVFNDLQLKNPEKEFWSCSRKRWMED